MNPRRALISGDWHGEFRAAQHCAKVAVEQNCDVIVQCGDFGYWPHTDPDYLMQVNAAMKRTNKKRDGEGLFTLFIDGNHENFDALLDSNWEITPEGFWKLDEFVYYAPRATRWEWSGVKFLALGGAHSIDKEWRLAQGPVGLYWWPQETIKQRDVYDCLNPPDGGEVEVDVMISHDMPLGTELGITLYKLDPEDDQNRMAVRTVVEHVKPKHLFHGHYHHRRDSLLHVPGQKPVEIHSLDMYRHMTENTGMWKVLQLAPDGAYAQHAPEERCPRCGEFGQHTCDAPRGALV